MDKVRRKQKYGTKEGNALAAGITGVASIDAFRTAHQSHKIIKRIPKAEAALAKRVAGFHETLKRTTGTPEAAKALRGIQLSGPASKLINQQKMFQPANRNIQIAAGVGLGLSAALAIRNMSKADYGSKYTEKLVDKVTGKTPIKKGIEKGKKLAGKAGRYIFRFFGGRVVPIRVK